MLNRLFVKIKRVLIECRYHMKNFGFFYAFSFFITSLIKQMKYKTRKRAIRICDERFGYIFEKNKLLGDNKIVFDNLQKNIFVFWAQGEKNMPPLVQICIKQIKKYYSDFRLICLDLENYNKYVDIPEYIIKLYENGDITIQTFSDILRFNLLYKYGGIWCDATLIMFKRYPFTELINKYGFWSINHDSIQKEKIWGKVYPVTYTTFFIATYKNNPIMKSCVEYYNDFYLKYNHAIDYFMNDYMLILCMKYGISNSQLNQIEFCKGTPFYLGEKINKLQDDIDISELKLCPQKLNWRTINIDRLEYLMKIFEQKEEQQ